MSEVTLFGIDLAKRVFQLQGTRSDGSVAFLGFGFYPRSGFMYINLGPARLWGERSCQIEPVC
ncbi:hypothetical protein SAMN04488078_10862 [Antarctobacter heliothermus]|uniref:Uncharacterized protein n=1 Tax=Antarctobacter heliothermus TaxID=74033 RepID=A0A239LEY0_9RHOB|nr:hypothetical protein [Antarctobacter heliothermus]SNT28084.1 hypothetical protein SAMN04488078_10862 [Antarctobacter heliothermus]